MAGSAYHGRGDVRDRIRFRSHRHACNRGGDGLGAMVGRRRYRAGDLGIYPSDAGCGRSCRTSHARAFLDHLQRHPHAHAMGPRPAGGPASGFHRRSHAAARQYRGRRGRRRSRPAGKPGQYFQRSDAADGPRIRTWRLGAIGLFRWARAGNRVAFDGADHPRKREARYSQLDDGEGRAGELFHWRCRRRLKIGLSYAAPPNYVREVILEALRNIPGVMQYPPPEVFTWEFGESAMQYRVRYWMSDFADIDRLRDIVSTGLWYVLRRKAIEIPYPQMVIRSPHARAANGIDGDFERGIMEGLRQVDFLRSLRDEELRLLVPGVIVQKFGASESIVREGDDGDSLFIIREGTVEVVAAKNGKQVHITDLAPPAFFGEMALMTGEKRTATIRARTDVELLELNRDAFGQLFKNHPETAAQMGEIIAVRLTERNELLDAALLEDGTHNRVSWLLSTMRAVFNLSAPR